MVGGLWKSLSQKNFVADNCSKYYERSDFHSPISTETGLMAPLPHKVEAANHWMLISKTDPGAHKITVQP
jgi:hypothetical protein